MVQDHINIAGERLTNQELRNAVYAGPWVSDAKRYFSKTNCPAARYGNSKGCNGYVKGESIRQEILETAIEWIADRDGTTVDGYMSAHQNDPTAQELWSYFRTVIEWTESLFPVYRREMKGLPWGLWYNQYHEQKYDPKALEDRVSELMADDDVTRKSGVYEYLLTGHERVLNIRAFTDRDRRAAYEKQKGICPLCQQHFELSEMQADHNIPWSKGGKTILENCVMLCVKDNIKKSNK